MNTKRCVCWFCLGQESARIWSKWLAWVCAWQVSSRGEFQEVAKAFHFGFRLKISVFWKAHSCPLLTFDLCSPGRGSTCVTPSSVRSCSSWAGELRCPGLKASDRQVQTHTHSLPVWCVSDSCVSCLYSEMVSRQPRLLVRHQRRPTTNQARVWKCYHHSGPDQLWILTDRKRLSFFFHTSNFMWYLCSTEAIVAGLKLKEQNSEYFS